MVEIMTENYVNLDVQTPTMDPDDFLQGQDIQDPSWLPFTTDGAMSFDKERHGTQGILTIHGITDLLGHLKEESAEEVSKWMEHGGTEREAPRWLADELLPLFTKSQHFECFVPALAVNPYIFPGTYPNGPRPGNSWIIYTIGLEISASAVVQIYKGSYTGTSGQDRLLVSGQGVSAAHQSFSLAKGQGVIRNGDPLSIVPGSGTVNSVFMTGIELPTARVAEFIVA
jgi:hypothetical protein